MKGEIIYKILDFLEDGSMDTADFFAAILKAGYGASSGKIDHEYKKYREETYLYQLDRDKRRNLQKYFSKLKSQGLIAENPSNQVILSNKGKKKLDELKKNKILEKNSYQKQDGDKVIIVSYDLPTVFNRERGILRDILKALGFQMIHKSVWVGKIKIPKKFVLAVEKMGILKFIEILEVTKNGTLNSRIK